MTPPIIALYTRHQQSPPTDFSLAQEWFALAQKTIDRELSQSQIARYESQILYYQAEIELRSGNYRQAKKLYQQTSELAKEIGFKRLMVYARGRMAVIAVESKQLAVARAMFQELLPIAEAHRDRRSIPLSQQYLATIERDRGHVAAARNWAERAIKSFDRLLMQEDADRMKSLIDSL